MKKGISTNRNVTASAACLKQAGIDFVFRYYSTTTSQPQKRLTLSEANAILAAGLSLAIVYEDGPTSADYFSSARGRRDARHASAAAASLGQPSGSAIYFTVDYDASAADISGPIFDYFLALQKSAVPFAIGVYGSGAVCDFIKRQHALAKYSWLAESKDWLGSKTYTGWDVHQAVPASDICAFTATPPTYENNQAHDDFGAITALNPQISIPATATT